MRLRPRPNHFKKNSIYSGISDKIKVDSQDISLQSLITITLDSYNQVHSIEGDTNYGSLKGHLSLCAPCK